MSDKPALELRGITKRFGVVRALDDADLVVNSGTVHALLGENGAGKTTLMRVAYGLTRPDSGSIVIDGAPRAFRSPAESISAGIGMVQQHPSNVPAMTAWENALLGGHGRLAAADARIHVQALAKQVGFALDPDAMVGDLSVAAQQRLEILKAVSRDARILILDEPTAILAPEEAADLYTWLRGFANGGGTVVVITHKLEEARRFTDDLTVLRGGRTVLTARSSAVSPAEIVTAMIGEAPGPTIAGNRSESAGAVQRAASLSLRDRRGLVVIKNADFVIGQRELLGIAGVEGSGHHELLLAMADRHAAAAGSVSHPERIAFVPEDRHRDASVLEFTLTENVALKGAGTRAGRMRWRSLAEHVSNLLTTYDVRASDAHRGFGTLSGGNQQKLILARELDGDPELIIVENPTRGLDVRAAAFVRKQLLAARDRGAAVVMYSSDLDELLEVADRVLVVHAGQVREVPRDRAAIGAAMLGVA